MPLVPSRRSVLIGSVAAPFISACPWAARAQGETRIAHALSLVGEPKYGPDFTHLGFVNPDAPRGGEVQLAAIGSFDSFNPYIIQGDFGPTSTIEALMTSPEDDPVAEYGLIAESIEVPGDQSWVAFVLRPEARWHDGQPITVDDVIFSFETLKEKGRPFFRAYYANVVKGEKTDDRRVKFTFDVSGNRELPQIMGQLPVLAKHYWEGRNFEAPTLEPPLASGPYKVESFEAGRTITLKRVPDYWGAKLPINIGQNNWDRIRYEYFRDQGIALEAFKAGSYDFHLENTAKVWATQFDIAQVRDGRIIKTELPNDNPTGMQGFIYNLRRPLFQDRTVRQALAYAFDFEWSNKALFYGQYTRTRSYFSNSDFASRGLPEGKEMAILEKYRGRVPEEVFTTEYNPPTTDGSGNIRANLRTAADLLKSAGWEVKDGRRTDTKTGKVLEFEMLLSNPAFERIVQPFLQNLDRLGVKGRIRTVETAQYQNRMDSYDFDMTVEVFGQSLSPGNEQRDFWGSASAERPGGRNTIGIKDPVVDELIEMIILAPDRDSLVASCRALDRILLWGHYLIPNWHNRTFRVAYWNRFGRPEITPRYGVGFSSWWIDPEKDAALHRT
jgi:microcin C transport system substrate-binding protein